MVLLRILKACQKTAYKSFPSFEFRCGNHHIFQVLSINSLRTFLNKHKFMQKIYYLKSRLIGSENFLKWLSKYTFSHLVSIRKCECPFRCVVGAVIFYIRFTLTSALFYVQWFQSFYKSDAHISKVHTLSFAIFNCFGSYLERRVSSGEPSKTLLNLSFLN